MRRSLICISALLLALAPLWAKASPSKITEVSVYADRAQVTRAASVNAQRGEVILTFDGLPAALDDRSVQVWGTGSAQATLEGVSVEMEPPPEVPEGRVGELKEKLQQLRDRKNLLEQKRKAIDTRIWLLVSVKPEPPRPENAVVWGNVADLEAVVSALVTGLRSAYSEQRAIDTELKSLGKEIAALEKELRKIQSPSGNRTKRILVNLTVSKAGPMDIMFSYIITGATWRPLYDIRALPEDGTVEIASYAEIIQRTGEDWKEASLSVSTAKPNVGGTPPTPTPIYLVFYSPPPPARPMAMPAPAPGYRAYAASEESADAMDASPAPAEPEAEAVIETAQVRTAGTAVFFEVKQRKTIPSDGEPHRVPIATDSIKAEFSHGSWPEASAFAFLRAKLTNTTGHPFVGGKANVFVGPSFIGSTTLEDWAVTEEKTLSLGVDQGVRVERKLVKRDEKESGSKMAITYEYKISVKNFKPKAITLELYDRVPSSRQGDIEVKVDDPRPAPTKREDNGIVMWRLNLAPGASTDVVFTYTIRYPKDRQVIGLP